MTFATVMQALPQYQSGLVRALGELADGREEYLLLCHPENRNWLEPLAGPNTKLVNRPQPPPRRTTATDRVM